MHRQEVIEGQVQYDPGISPPVPAETPFQPLYLGMAVGEFVNPLMVFYPAQDRGRQDHTVQMPAKIAHQITDNGMLVPLRQPEMREVIHYLNQDRLFPHGELVDEL